MAITNGVHPIDDVLGITAIVGEEGSCKTTMGLSYPKKLVHFDVDVGGFRRAAWRIPNGLVVKVLVPDEPMSSVSPADFDILSKPYPRPIQIDKLLGQKSDVTSRNIQITFPKKVEGMKELWQKIIIDFVTVCQMPEVSTIMLDSATLLWFIDHNSHLQELQERQLYRWQSDPVHKNTPYDPNDYRERLQPIEYGEANDRMRQLFQTSRAFNKNLVMTHYPTDVYGPISDGKGGFTESKTGEKVLDGFKETAKLVDVVVWTSVKTRTIPADPKTPGSKPRDEKYPVAKFAKAGVEGMGISAVGMEIPATFEGIINLRNLMRMGGR